MKAKEVLRLLKIDGWYEIAQKGSYLQLKHDVKPGKVTLPIHSGDVPLWYTKFNFKTGRAKIILMGVNAKHG